jgi:zinc/manganese transport system substrate-binding protein/zinc transport system substrate-binding protein
MRRWAGWAAGLILLTGCAKEPTPTDDGKIHVLCSFFPMYLFAQNVVGNTPGVSVDLMLPSQLGCPHDYDLTPDDVKRIAQADLYVMNGAGLESFGEEQVRSANPKVVIVDTSRGIESLLDADSHDHEGHDHAHDDHHDHDHAHDHDAKHDHHDHAHDHAHDHKDGDKGHSHAHAGGKNPHFFSSPKLAVDQVKAIVAALKVADPAHAEDFEKNGNAYIAKLEACVSKLEEASKSFTRREIVTMHEVFDYLAKDCGLSVVATIYPVAGQDPSPADVRQVIDRVKEAKAAAIFTEPQYPSQLGKTIADEAGIAVEVLDPVASGPADAGVDYYEKTMMRNAETLAKVLGGKES